SDLVALFAGHELHELPRNTEWLRQSLQQLVRIREIRVCYLLAALAAATILSKRLSPRKSSQHGLKRRSPYEGPFGIVATVSSCSSARARSPVHVETSARRVTRLGPQYESLAIGKRSTARSAWWMASSFRPSPASNHAS